MFRAVVPRALALIALLALVPLTARGADKPVVTVFAAASLRAAFEAAAPAFTKQTGYPVRFSFAGSDTLAAQLLQGAPADAFVAANEAQMKRVAALVDRPRTLAYLYEMLRPGGVLVLGAGRNTTRLAPPLLIAKEQVDATLRALDDALTDGAGGAHLAMPPRHDAAPTIPR